jgi:hypothetical protein
MPNTIGKVMKNLLMMMMMLLESWRQTTITRCCGLQDFREDDMFILRASHIMGILPTIAGLN